MRKKHQNKRDVTRLPRPLTLSQWICMGGHSSDVVR